MAPLRRDVAKAAGRPPPATETAVAAVCPGTGAAMPGPEQMKDTGMQKKWMLSGAALAAVVLAGLSTAVLADWGGDRMGFEGPIPRFDFAAIDADQDGKVTRAELDAWRTARLTEADTDKDGKLSPAELKAQVMARVAERADDMAARMVTRMDRDGDGLIAAAERAGVPEG